MFIREQLDDIDIIINILITTFNLEQRKNPNIRLNYKNSFISTLKRRKGLSKRSDSSNNRFDRPSRVSHLSRQYH
jgi:hypothetical protein